MSIKNTDAIENNIQNGVQHVNSDESNNKIAKLTTKTLNQRTNGPVNAHLISWPSNLSTKPTKPGKIYGKEMTLTFNTHIPS